MSNPFEAQFAALRQRYLGQLPAIRDDIMLLSGPKPKSGTCGDCKQLGAIAHKLAGSGATYGFPAISDAGLDLDILLKQVADPAADDVGALSAALLEAIEAALRPEDGAKAKTDAPKGKKPAAKRTAKAVKAKARMVVVDDDKDITGLLETLFAGQVDVTVCHEAAEGWETILRTKPDVVVLDNEMPGEMTGVDLLAKLRGNEQTQEVPIVMLTANGTPDKVMEALIAGANDYIVKPFESHQLARSILDLLSHGALRVLLVDDDEIVVELLEHKLRHAGYHTTRASDGEEAWEILQKEKFDLVLLDRMMPGIDGMTLLHMMRDLPQAAETPVVFLTARRFGSDVVNGLEQGAADYITKPFDPEEVVVRCGKYLRQAAA